MEVWLLDLFRSVYMVMAGLSIFFLVILCVRMYRQGRQTDHALTWYCLALLTGLVASVVAVAGRIGNPSLSPALIIRYGSMLVLLKAFSYSFDFKWWKHPPRKD